MEEIWKDIKGYEGLYQISNFGRVKSFLKRKERILKAGASGDGYLAVFLYGLDKSKLLKVHRLVAMAFIQNKENKPEVNHKDGNLNNNHVDNLEWVTSSENKRHSYDILKRKGPRWCGKINIFSQTDDFLVQVNDTKQAAEWVRRNTDSYHKVVCQCIRDACRGKKQKTAYGYIFKYANEKP